MNEEIKEPIFYCPVHGRRLNVEHLKAYNIITGKKSTEGFKSTCPKFFCGYSILTGVVPQR